MNESYRRPAFVRLRSPRRDYQCKMITETQDFSVKIMEFEKELDCILIGRANDSIEWLKKNRNFEMDSPAINLAFLSSYSMNERTNSLLSLSNKLFYLTIVLAVLTLLMLILTFLMFSFTVYTYFY